MKSFRALVHKAQGRMQLWLEHVMESFGTAPMDWTCAIAPTPLNGGWTQNSAREPNSPAPPLASPLDEAPRRDASPVEVTGKCR